MSYKLFLDDERMPDWVYTNTNNNDWVIVRDMDEFKKCIEEKGMAKHISFDHDLSDINSETSEEKTGMSCAKWLVDFCIDNSVILPDFNVHSANPAGKKNIIGLLSNFKKEQTNRRK